MNETPLVSIITPSYNQADYLEKTIQSVLSQTYPKWEYIIIDGGSTDGSKGIIQKYESKLHAWVSEPDMGQSDAINKGFRLASGDIFAWLNSDDCYYPNAVMEAVNYLTSNPEVGMVYGDTDLIDETGKVIGQFDARQTNYQRLMRGYGNIPQPAAFWRAETWYRFGPLDTSLFFAMDYDLWVKFSKGTQIRYYPELWASFRVHGQGKTNKSFDLCWPEMRKVHQKEGGRLFSIFMGRYLLRKLFAPAWNWIKKSVLKN